MTATYTVRAEPGKDGQRIWLELELENRLDRGFFGVTGGFLEVDEPDTTRPLVIEWGGSSADDIAVRRRSTSNRPIYNFTGNGLQARSGSQVTLLGVYTSLARGPYGRGSCSLPAQMRAPQVLVSRHPTGSWFLTIKQGERIRLLGKVRNL